MKNVTLRKQSSRSGRGRETAVLVLRKEEFCTQQNSLQHAAYMKMVLHIRGLVFQKGLRVAVTEYLLTVAH